VSRQRFTVIPAVYLILRSGNEVLLQRRRGTGFGDGEYALIQGHVEGDETAPGALVREARGEAGIEIDARALDCVHVMHRNSKVGEWFDLFFTIDHWTGEPRICEPDKCDDLGWFAVDALPANVMANIRHALESWRRGETFSLWGWDAKSRD
jgi:8-oxo-dGTP pyrophosphatase MutT (NUDIX family)